MITKITYKELGNNGRLGNQLFQIATTISHAKKIDAQYSLPAWAYASCFKNQLNYDFNPEDITHQYSEPWFHYNEIGPEHTYLIKHDNEKQVINLHGYFQSEKYFEHCKELIKEQFEFADFIKSTCSNKIKEIKQTNPNKRIVSIHLRFGDYVNNPYYNQLTMDGYYNRAVDHLFNHSEEILYLVFSDDHKLASEFMSGLLVNETHHVQYMVIENTNEIGDFVLMSMCDDNIIANSSFSWWASYLNKNIKKTIIAPRTWFGAQANLNTKDLYTKDMIIL